MDCIKLPSVGTRSKAMHCCEHCRRAHEALGDVDFEAGAAILLAAQVAGEAAGLAVEACSARQHAWAPNAPLRQSLAGIPVMLHGLICESPIAPWAPCQTYLQAPADEW